jgi:D-beta-D-heptose 7-phosphate kinase/D-beta-D-heptose 1-phosphate adenosyltransferase
MPDVLIKGSDYTGAQIVGADEVILGGGKVQLIDIVQGKSTTSIIEKVTKINKVNSSDGGLHWSR